MPYSRAQVDRASPRTRARIAEDLATYGPRAEGLSRAAVIALVGDVARGEYLHAWLSYHGRTSPLAPPRAPRPPAPPDDGWRTHLVVGDCHAAPDTDLRRFADLGSYVARTRPDVLVQIGDWYSLDTLCTHETPRRRAEGRLIDDLAAGEAALAAYHGALGDPAGIDHHITLGNHDVRVDALADEEPWMEGIYAVGAAHEARGWTVHRYRRPARIDGIRYQHDLPQRGGKRPISGKYAPQRLLERVLHAESIVVGHSHVLQYATEAPHVGRRVHAVVVGCYLDHVEEYAGEDNAVWWSGVVRLSVRAGEIGEITFVPRWAVR